MTAIRILIPALLALYLMTSASAAAAPPEVLDTVEVEDSPLGVAINPLTNRVYVANYSGSVSVIDGTTHAVVSTVPVGGHPFAVGVNTATNRIYVANSESPAALSAIDGATDTVVDTIPLGLSGLAGTGLAVNPETDRIYVPSILDNSVAVVDGSASVLEDVIEVGEFPVGVDVNPVTNTVYVGNGSDGTMSVIDGATNTVTSTIDLGPSNNPFGVAVNAVTNRVYVAAHDVFGSDIGEVLVIDGETEQVIDEIEAAGQNPSGGNGQGLKLDPAIDKVYVTDGTVDSGSIQVIDGATSTIESTIELDEQAEGVAVTPETNRIYVTHSTQPGTVTVLGREGDGDGDRFSDGAETNMGTDPLDVCAAGAANDAWPPDRDMDSDADVGDLIQSFSGKILNPSNYDARSDPNGDGENNVGDLVTLYGQGNMLSKCVAFTFTNATGGPVDDIHIEWSEPALSVFHAQDSQVVGWNNSVFTNGGLTLDLDRVDGFGDLADGGQLTLIVQTAALMTPSVASCEWTLDGASQGAC